VVFLIIDLLMNSFSFTKFVCILLVIIFFLSPCSILAHQSPPGGLTCIEKVVAGSWITVIISVWFIKFINNIHVLKPVPESPTISAMQYLFTNNEKRTYKKLKTEAERIQFINEYWLSHDPNPDTPENAPRDEYIRRVSLAMNKYWIPGSAGWKTDQGRVIIIYGEPNAIYHYNYHVSEGLALAHFNSFLTLEFWIYDRPQGPNPIPFEFSELNPGSMFFVFDQSMGNFQNAQIYSTEFGEIVDGWLY